MEPFKYLTPAHPYLEIKNLKGSCSLELTKSKPFNCKVLTLLENIHSIIKDEIRITNSREFSNLTRYDLCKKLRVIAKEIKVKYCNQIKGSSSFSMIFKTDLTERVEKKYAQIRKIVHTKTKTPKHDPSNFGLPLELIYKIFKYLNYNDVKSYSQVDRMAHKISQKMHIEHAQKLNYRGNDYANALNYLKSIHEGLNYIYQEGLIVEKFAIYKNLQNKKEIDFTATLKHWSEYQLTRDMILKSDPIKKEVMDVLIYNQDPAAPSAITLMCGWGDHPDSKDKFGYTELSISLASSELFKLMMKHPYKYKPVSTWSGPFGW